MIVSRSWGTDIAVMIPTTIVPRRGGVRPPWYFHRVRTSALAQSLSVPPK